MRVIAGSARRLLLKTVEGLDTRPTTDRIKETLFNILQNEISGSTVLDLFAGSGAIGIEALSRGAREAVFIENGSRQAACIRDNLRTTRLMEKAVVMECDVLKGISRLSTQKKFDFIFLDPPYLKGIEQTVLNAVRESGAAGRDTLIIVEAALITDFSWAESFGYRIVRRKEYKTNQHVFLKLHDGGDYETSHLPREL